MKVCLMRAALLLLATCAPLLAAPPPLPAEHLTVTTLPPNAPHRIYVLDEAFNNEIDARIHVFDGSGRLIESAWILLGQAIGDDSVPGIGSKAIADIPPEERTTPAGRFVTMPGRNANDRPVVWVDYDGGVSMHVVITGTPGEHRLERLASPDPARHRISWGCINLPADFFKRVVQPAFAEPGGIVYVLPETRPLGDVFALASSTVGK